MAAKSNVTQRDSHRTFGSQSPPRRAPPRARIPRGDCAPMPCAGAGPNPTTV